MIVVNMPTYAAVMFRSADCTLALLGFEHLLELLERDAMTGSSHAAPAPTLETIW